ncbi:MAG: hypothetical protein ACXVA9_04455 [Bdellovibrionales bacterium]
MRFVFVFILAVRLAPAWAEKPGGVGCYDNEHTVELSAKLVKNNSDAYDLRIQSNEKARPVKKSDISRMRSNSVDFYILFTVQTKSGPEELELDTHFAGDHKTSVGFLTNKTQKSERLPVTCKFK